MVDPHGGHFTRAQVKIGTGVVQLVHAAPEMIWKNKKWYIIELKCPLKLVLIYTFIQHFTLLGYSSLFYEEEVLKSV